MTSNAISRRFLGGFSACFRIPSQIHAPELRRGESERTRRLSNKVACVHSDGASTVRVKPTWGRLQISKSSVGVSGRGVLSRNVMSLLRLTQIDGSSWERRAQGCVTGAEPLEAASGASDPDVWRN